LALAAREKGLKLESRIDPLMPRTLVGDPGRLRQVILNLLGNAIKFTHSGQVALLVSVDARQDAECVLHVCVQDTGVGIALDKQAHLLGFSRAHVYNRVPLQKLTARRFHGVSLLATGDLTTCRPPRN
jgi:signal transduction histidine kinase